MSTELIDVVTARQLLDLVGGLILLLATYYAVMARKHEHARYRKAYRHATVQLVAGFLLFAYAAFVLWPESGAWPARTGEHLWLTFQELETVPERVDAQLSDYYMVLLKQVGLATGTSTGMGTSMLLPGVLGGIESMVRTIGIIVYTVAFTIVSLSVQLPQRLLQGASNAVGTDDAA